MHVALQATRKRNKRRGTSWRESKPKKRTKSSTKRSFLQDKWTSWRPERVTDEGYATSEYISCALRMHESIYSTTRSCEPLLNRAAFSFRSPFMGRNLRSLKRRHGTTRADLYTASLFLGLSLFFLTFSSLFTRYRVTRLNLWECFAAEYISNVISWRRSKRLVSHLCIWTVTLSFASSKRAGTRSIWCLWRSIWCF